MDSVTIPVMAKVRIGHFVEAQILESLSVDFIDESEGKQLLHSVHTAFMLISLMSLNVNNYSTQCTQLSCYGNGRR